MSFMHKQVYEQRFSGIELPAFDRLAAGVYGLFACGADGRALRDISFLR